MNLKFDKYMTEYKSLIEEKQLVQQKYNQMQLINQKLSNEKNDLIEKNQNLKNEISNLYQKIKMNKIKYQNNEYILNKNITQMTGKLAEYKQKVITLKLKIKEMYGNNNQQVRLINQNNNNNLVNKQNFNNFIDIQQIPLTPDQKKKFSGMSHGNMRINKMPEKGGKLGPNPFYYNQMKKNLNNNF